VANTQRSSVDGAELGKGSMSARGTSVAGDGLLDVREGLARTRGQVICFDLSAQ